jgi:MFS family permease
MTGRKLALLTRRQLAFVVTVCFSLTFQATNFAMMAAFFPLYAAEVGISITQTNAVFIAYSVAKMLMSPVAGALASRFGRRRVLIGGIALVGCSTVFIGLTPDLTQREVMPMVAVMMGARVLQGVGLSCSQLATFAMLSDSFPAHRSLVSGSAISAIGLGWAIGPPIGGVLYVIGGFRLPFVVMGAIPLALLCPLLTLTTGAGGMESSGASIAAHNSKGTDTGRQAWRAKTPIQLVARKPDVWIVAFTAFGYMSKWGWWDIQVRLIATGILCVAARTNPLHKPAREILLLSLAILRSMGLVYSSQRGASRSFNGGSRRLVYSWDCSLASLLYWFR